MNHISIIACIGKNRELGKNNHLIWHLPNDLKYFKKVTSGKTVIMGRKTFESLPGVLPNRRNIILTKNDDMIIEGVEIFHDIKTLLENLKDEQEVFIIGGSSIYKQFLDYADTLYLTEVKQECKDADVYFPKFNKMLYNKEVMGKENENDITYQFVKYTKK